MDWIFGLAMLLGIGPALILMYLGVRNYTYPKVEQPFFSDPTFFILLVVGMIAGSILFFAMIAMGFASNVVYMVILAAIEAMVLVVVMNLKRFRGKSDSMFYGYALGLGMSCGLSTGIVFVTASTVETFDASVIVLVLISVSMSLMLGACGTTVGEGIARHRVMEFALQAMIPLIIYNILLTVLLQGGELGGMVAYYVCAAVALVFGAVLYYRTMLIRLPQIVREVLKMEGKKRDDLPK
ncbi:hypothetical protein JS82_01590 [Methanomassiliicoccaceae archaeon DOK]|nr:hypothetical protein JS82_01590 [Methanomassiliicoccaceae archaeon DOK]